MATGQDVDRRSDNRGRRAWIAATVTGLGVVLGACGGSSATRAAPRPAAQTADAAVTASPPTTNAPAATSSPGGGFCDLIRTYRQRLTDLEQQGLGDPGRMGQFMSDVMAALDQAVRIAPGDVRADITLIRDATKNYAPMLATAGYDVRKLPPRADNPLLRPDVQAANERQATYVTQACGAQD